jgi:tRNA G46 methylase TrmB
MSGGGQGLLLRKLRAKYPGTDILGVEFSRELVKRANKLII